MNIKKLRLHTLFCYFVLAEKLMAKYEGSKWCVGNILRRNKDANRKVKRQHINLYVYYEFDEQEATHALSLDNYNREGTGEALYQQWVLLENVVA